jgi:phenylalanyl-tRNA synthetase alpha subunit
MEKLLQQIEDYKKEIVAFTAADDKQVDEFRIKFLGTKGIVKAIMAEMKYVPAENKKEFGQVVNEFKQFAEAKLETLKASTSNNELLQRESSRTNFKHRPVTARRPRPSREPASDNPDEKQGELYIPSAGICSGRRTGD